MICCWFTLSWGWRCRRVQWSSVWSFYGPVLNASFPCSICVRPRSTALVRFLLDDGWWRVMMHLLLYHKTKHPWKGLSLLALATVNGYHGYVLFAWFYGFCLGGYQYALHQYTLDRVRARQFARGWSLVLAVRALPTLFGVPIAGILSAHFAHKRQLIAYWNHALYQNDETNDPISPEFPLARQCKPNRIYSRESFLSGGNLTLPDGI